MYLYLKEGMPIVFNTVKFLKTELYSEKQEEGMPMGSGVSESEMNLYGYLFKSAMATLK